MRFSFFVLLVVAITVGSTYWYQSTKYICPIPLSYRLGDIDESFSITQAEAFSAIDAAIAVWEDEVEKDLFVYDPQADLAVSFVFDDRQAAANAQLSDEERLNNIENENQELKSRLDELQFAFAAQQTSFSARKSAYEKDLQKYNDKVRQANDRGGATTDEFEDLKNQQQALEAEANSLRAASETLNKLATQINNLSREGNRLVEAYNQQVSAYNSSYSSGEEFTQGDYTGDEIHIYKFSNNNELISVLAHEFGHALGIDHVGQTGSLMYYLLDEDNKKPTLSLDDKAALVNVCQTETASFRLRQFIRSFIS